MNSAWNARDFAETLLSSNPTGCAAWKALQAYDIFGEISPLRLSQVALEGRKTNFDLKLQKFKDEVDASVNDCKNPQRLNFPTESADDRSKRLEANDWEFSRKVFNTEECTLLRFYDGSSFAKPHHGSFEGCKAECDLEPKCNAFNMGLPFAITVQRTNCDLLECPSGASRMEKFG